MLYRTPKVIASLKLSTGDKSITGVDLAIVTNLNQLVALGCSSQSDWLYGGL